MQRAAGNGSSASMRPCSVAAEPSSPRANVIAARTHPDGSARRRAEFLHRCPVHRRQTGQYPGCTRPHGKVLVGKQVAEQFVSFQRFLIDCVQRRRVMALIGNPPVRALSLTVTIDSFPVPPARPFLDIEITVNRLPQKRSRSPRFGTLGLAHISIKKGMT